MEQYGKIWGSTAPIFKTPVFELHRLVVKEGYQCSTHVHQFKYNGFYVEDGSIVVKVYQNDYDLVDETVLGPGQSTIVKPGVYHLFHVLSDGIVYEAYWPELLSDDIIRKTVGKKV